jgi:LytS/YehU family sensor histidine kinase
MSEATDRQSLEEGVMLRVVFTLLGAILSYGLYRCLEPLLQRAFGQQITAGAALALATALVQALVNSLMFENQELSRLGNFLYAAMYWFWFHFSWTTAYLALSYSFTVQAQERNAAELAIQAQEAHLRALRYQINPHFLYNTLNAIAALVRDAPDRAEVMLVQLSDFFRQSLAVNPEQDVTLGQEVELQRLYLEIERTRFPDRLRFEVALDAGSAEAKVPSLMLQPLIENAVKHGVARCEAPSCIRILARVAGPALEIVVENDAKTSGLGVAGEKVGLRNVQDRLRSQFGETASLETSEVGQGGFRNTLRIPFRR